MKQLCQKKKKQTTTLHTNYDESKTTLPCLYILREKITKATFTRMFRKIKQLVGINVSPLHYLCDTNERISSHGKVLADNVQLRIGKNPCQKQCAEWKENDATKRRIVNTCENQPDKLQFDKILLPL